MREYRDHILDCKDALIKSGISENEAEKEAVRQMGDPLDAGMEMNRIYRELIDWQMIFWFLLCSVFVQGMADIVRATFQFDEVPYVVLMYIGIFVAMFGFIWSALEKYNDYNLFYVWARDWGRGGLINSGVHLAVAVFFLTANIQSAIKLTLIFALAQTVIRCIATLLRNKRESELLWQIGVADTFVTYKGKGVFANKKIRIKAKEKGEEIQPGTPIMIVGLEGAKPVVERV